ncbi:hypothetical protein [Candidatus Korarchaeum cryptofilum]|jgi:hypothetical protein|uniref:hypothetical protein n=1 Tax=Candidatus Korarchaeum cryptofilum TaxID=498846 RepID=UPI00164FC4B5|nr:hypothetical protein [Candidatus Korarchaeum cryptofilum]
MSRGKQKEQLFEIRVSPGIFDWCSPEEFEEALKLYLVDRRNKTTEEVKKEERKARC